jgi:negative regulator of sigma-B (phosphoserine phosphatase)
MTGEGERPGFPGAPVRSTSKRGERHGVFSDLPPAHSAYDSRMKSAAPHGRPVLECGFAGAALEGRRSGDVPVHVPFSGGALLAVIDGLGHGPEAALAAETAATALALDPAAAVAELVVRCHDALRNTRGALMTLASVDAPRSTLTWCGVGDVEGVLLRAHPMPGRSPEVAPTRAGVVGAWITPVKVRNVPLFHRDLIVLASDGIRSGFTQSVDPERTPQEIANRIFERHARTSDDALVLVARYLGDGVGART